MLMAVLLNGLQEHGFGGLCTKFGANTLVFEGDKFAFALLMRLFSNTGHTLYTCKRAFVCIIRVNQVKLDLQEMYQFAFSVPKISKEKHALAYNPGL